MSFLSPLFLLGAAVAAVPILLHLMRRRTEQRVRFAAVALLKNAPVEQRSRRRLRELLLLALRVTAIVLFALAFARPFFRSATASSGRLTVVAVDTSLSMSARPTFARARQFAKDALMQAPAGDDVAVVAFSDRGETALAPTSNRVAAADAVDRLQPGLGGTSYGAGLSAAGELFRGRAGTIAIVTDLQSSGWDAGSRGSVPASVRVDVRDVSAETEDLGVESIRAEGQRVIASIRNAGARARDVHAGLTIDGRPAGQTVINVGAHSAGEATFPDVRAAGVAAVSIDDPGGIAGDDVRYIIVGSDAPAAALVVTTSGDLDKDAWYVRHALVGARGVPASEMSARKDADLSRYGAIVLLSTRGLERSARALLADYVNAGGGMLIAAGPDVDGEIIGGVLGSGASLALADRGPERAALHFTPADVRHPVFRAFGSEVGSLGLVTFQHVARVGGRTCQVIAQFTSGAAAVLDCAAGAGRAIVVASDLDHQWNDWPVRASYVPFLDQATRYLASGGRRSSEYLVSDVPSGVPPRPGVTTVKTDAGTRRIVVNVDPKEMPGDRMTPAEFQASITRLQDAASEHVRANAADEERRQHVWQYLVAAMIVALLAESVVAARAA